MKEDAMLADMERGAEEDRRETIVLGIYLSWTNSHGEPVLSALRRAYDEGARAQREPVKLPDVKDEIAKMIAAADAMSQSRR